MTDPLQHLLDLVVQARTQVQADAHMQALTLALWPLVQQQARNVMRGKPGGLNLADPEDLASAGMAHFVDPLSLGVLKFQGRSVGELVTYVRGKLNFLHIDDVRKLLGRLPKKAKDEGGGLPDEPEANPSTDEVDGVPALTEGQRTTKAKASPFLPRVYVDVQDDKGNDYLPSDRRSATGYLLLKQTKNYLHEYLNLMPGSVVMVPYGPRSKQQGTRPVRLTTNHAKLLRVWMSGEGDDQWKAIAAQMGTAVGNVKRWWSEAVAVFQLDDSPQAQALRSLYRINPAHTRRANEAMDEPEDDDGDDDNALTA